MDTNPSPPSPHTPAVVFLSIWMAVITLALTWGVIRVWPMAAVALTPPEKVDKAEKPDAKEPTQDSPAAVPSKIPPTAAPGEPTPPPAGSDAKILEAADRAAKAAEQAIAAAKQASDAAGQIQKTSGDAMPFGPKGTIVILILLLGAAGAQIHAIQSFADFVGNGTFASRWLIWYMKRPIMGALLALTVYAGVGGGVIGLDAAFGEAGGNLWGLTAICLLSGMFSRLVTDKLREVFTILLAVKPGEQPERKDPMKGSATVPVVEKLEPATVSATTPVPVKIIGRNFTEPSKVRVGDQEPEVKFISGTELELPAASLPTKPGKYGISAIDPATKTGSSTPVDLEISL